MKLVTMLDRKAPTEASQARSRRRMMKLGGTAVAAGLLACVETTLAQAGFGKCYKCPCAGFEGNGDVCTNCGHNYIDHW